eukprot:4650336-Pyramimonas_sp.AAC.2
MLKRTIQQCNVPDSVLTALLVSSLSLSRCEELTWALLGRDTRQKAAAPKYGGFKAIDCLHSNYTRAINPYKEKQRVKPDVEIIW